METLNNGRWNWDDIVADLEKAGAKGVMIDPLSVRGDYFFAGATGKGKFTCSWVKDTLLIVSLEQDDPALIEAFARIIEYRPFCRYRSRESGLLTYEWDKVDPRNRFKELQEEGEPELQ